MQQIMLAGLTTKTSDGKTLQSGGMFYLSPTSENKVSIAKPIGMQVPTATIKDSMKLYNGVEKDGKISWEKPIPFRVKKTLPNGPDGKALFASNCAQCHSIAKYTTGPALAYMGRNRSKWYLETFTNNWEDAVAVGDCQAIKIQNFAPTTMNKFNLKENEIKAIYDYIDATSAEMGLPFVDDGVKAQQDSCEQYRKEILKLSKLEKQKKELMDDNGPNVKYKAKNMPITPPTPPRNTPSASTNNEALKDYVQPVQTTSTYYQLEITQFGWNNLDDRPTYDAVQLFATIDAQYKGKVKLFLAIPQLRILLDGGEATNGMFAFEETNGNIKLPLGRDISLLAIGEADGKFLFGKIDIVVKEHQQLNIPISASTKNAFNDAMLTMGWNGLDIKAQEAKNVSAIKALVYEIEKIKTLKPKQGCDCALIKKL
jgi:mono/diheme cytochrome c family protein